ncbi:MAG: glutaredoxin family protein [FCB group bacterium]|nr:glutaredoxin family protein [FCB group bacterium]
MAVTMYTKPGCPFCAAARDHYNNKGIAFDEIDVIDNPEAQKKVLELSGGKKIVPVVVDGDDIKIGWNGG